MGFALGKGEITGNGLYVGPGVPEDPETGQSERMVISRGYGACAVDVKVNVETGEVKILRVSAAFDGGQAINPKMIEGQIESGLVMGIGTALFEEMVMDKGTVVNRNFMDYKIPTSMDLPGRENIAIMLAGVPHREGPFGAKGIGEAAAIPFPPAISQALYDATGVRINDLPLSREKILMHLKEG
jgi:CO/xanthine dehydrogenase Mo-binding subunit